MFISKEMANAMAEGRKRFLSVYEGRAVLLMPFPESVRHVATHYVPELHRSVMCEGEGNCRFCFLQQVAKIHVAAWVFRSAAKFEDRASPKLPDHVVYDPAFWSAKIVELTEHCFEAFGDGQEYGTLATLGREPGRKNNKVHFHWLLGRQLENFPPQPLQCEQITPAVIRGTFYNKMETTIDKTPDGRTKHNSN